MNTTIRSTSFQTATANYLSWLKARVRPIPEIFEAQIEEKVVKMQGGLFPFLRGTYYRWAELWPQHCPGLASRSDHIVVSVGDLHMENFGTWRDEEDHLIWGVNDFDEASELPFTHDLVRLATSALVASEDLGLPLNAAQIAAKVLEGYQAGCASGGGPFLLETASTSLRPLIDNALRSNSEEDFWAKLRKAKNYPLATAALPLPKAAEELLAASLPADTGSVEYRVVVKAKGLGSLGRPRFIALGKGEYGSVGREAKRIVPSAVEWLRDPDSDQIDAGRLAIPPTPARSPDPTYRIAGEWAVRAMYPDAVKIELGSLGPDVDRRKAMLKLLVAMGKETANIHLGSESGVDLLRALAELASSDRGWLEEAATAMRDATVADRSEFLIG